MEIGSDVLILFGVLGAIIALAFVVPSFAPYRRKMPFVAFLLGISSGFPLTLLLGTMTFWLSKVGIDKSAIGFAIGLTTPYTLEVPVGAARGQGSAASADTGSLASDVHGCFSSRHCCSARCGSLAPSNPTNGDLTAFALWAIVVAFLLGNAGHRNRRLSHRNSQRR